MPVPYTIGRVLALPALNDQLLIDNSKIGNQKNIIMLIIGFVTCI